MPIGPAIRLAVAGMLLTAIVTACAPSTNPSATGASAAPPDPTGAVPTLPDDPTANPPNAILAVEGGEPVAGALGSFSWGDVGSASPWLPGTPITVGAGETATMSVDARVPIASWRARAAAAPDGSLANGLSNGGPQVSFAVPGPGEWTIEITVQFGQGMGSASYYWRMTVQ